MAGAGSGGGLVSYVERKSVDWGRVSGLLGWSGRLNWWSNFGPACCALEGELGRFGRAGTVAVACSSGTAAVHALVRLCEWRAGCRLTWAVPGFSFACCRLGPLEGAVVVDCDGEGVMDVGSVPPGVGGVVLMDPFGNLGAGVWGLAEGLRARGLAVVVDSALGLDGGGLGDCSAVSLHQTKPWGLGEGGVMYVDAGDEAVLRGLISFGRESGSTNAKLSDYSAAVSHTRVMDLGLYSGLYRGQYARVAGLASGCGYRVLGRASGGTPSCVGLVASGPVWGLRNRHVVLGKYYPPLGGAGSWDLYSRLVCFPCHAGVAALGDDEVLEVLTPLLHHSW